MRILAGAVYSPGPGGGSTLRPMPRSGAVPHAAISSYEPGTIAGLPVAAYTVGSVCSPAGDFELTLHATDGDLAARRRTDLCHWQCAGAADGRTGCAEFDHHDVGW